MGLDFKANWPRYIDARSAALVVRVTAILDVAMGAVVVMSADTQGSAFIISLSPSW